MLSQPKATPAASSSTSAAPSTPAPASAQTPAPPAAPAPASSSTGDAPATPSPAPGGQASQDLNDPSALALGAQREAAIANMESMGFARAEIDRAMRAAYFNPDRAVEYLLNGIPENVQQEQRQQAPSGAPGSAGSGGNRPASTQPTAPATASPPPASAGEEGDQPINLFEAAAQAGRGGAPGGARSGRTAGTAGLGNPGSGGASTGTGGSGGAGGAGGLGDLDFLRNNPQFQQLRQIVQTQPRMLEPILQQVGHGNPQLAQMIGENPEQFLRLLSEDVGDDTPLPPGAQEISVTEEERDAIERVSHKPAPFFDNLC